MDKNRLFDHQEDLLVYARYLTRDKDAAEELVQDAVCRILSIEGGLEDVRQPRAYMAGVLRHLFLDQRRKRLSLPPQVPLGDYDPADETGDAFEALACVETLAAIDRLPPDLRRVLWMRVEGTMSYGEMAERLKVPVGTVMSRISRARKRLRVEIGEVACR